MSAPPLKHGAGSWIITKPGPDGFTVETWSRKTADQAASLGYDVKTIIDHLAQFNRSKSA
jgi:hypothetical protein